MRLTALTTAIILAASALATSATTSAGAATPVAHRAEVAPRTTVNTGRQCDYHTYKSHYTVSVGSVIPRLTNLSKYTLPPSGLHTETRWSAFSAKISASVDYSSGASVSASGLTKIIGKASVETNLALHAAGSATYAHRVQVTTSISNPLRQSATFPFYKGASVARGQFRHYYCEQENTRPVRLWKVFYDTGRWVSYGSLSQGAVRCGDSTTRLDSVAKLALRIGCA